MARKAMLLATGKFTLNFPAPQAKHEPICFKTKANAKRRGTFDTSKVRQAALDVKPSKETLRETKSKVAKVGRTGVFSRRSISRILNVFLTQAKTANWRIKHEQFVNAIRDARGVSKVCQDTLRGFSARHELRQLET